MSLVQPKGKGGKHCCRIIVVVEWIYYAVFSAVGKKIVHYLLLEEIVPEIFALESVLLQCVIFLDDCAVFRCQFAEIREVHVDLLWLFMIIIVDDDIATMDDELVLVEVLVDLPTLLAVWAIFATIDAKLKYGRILRCRRSMEVHFFLL